MPQIRNTFPTLFLLSSLSFFLLAGCGDSNPQSNFDPSTGEHPSGWLPAGHKAEALAHTETCAECHGADYFGGVSGVACTQCHLGNQDSIHPNQWGNYAYALHGNYAKLNGTTSCATEACHGANLTGTTEPGRSGPSCTECHLGGPTSAHPTDWVGDVLRHGGYALARGTETCENAACHGPGLNGVFLSGPACNTCHT